MAYKRIHVSELKPNQSARRLLNRDGTGEFDGTYVIRAGSTDFGIIPYIYMYPCGEGSAAWNIFKEPIDEIVEVEV